jgi:hypothetical protein
MEIISHLELGNLQLLVRWFVTNDECKYNIILSRKIEEKQQNLIIFVVNAIINESAA